jgi:hypothetical protein
MVPHDQQFEVASPGTINDDFDIEFAIHNLGRTYRPPLESQRWDGRGRPSLHYAENELPHPHDFVEFGFTNTNPCCIRVS